MYLTGTGLKLGREAKIKAHICKLGTLTTWKLRCRNSVIRRVSAVLLGAGRNCWNAEFHVVSLWTLLWETEKTKGREMRQQLVEPRRLSPSKEAFFWWGKKGLWETVTWRGPPKSYLCEMKIGLWVKMPKIFREILTSWKEEALNSSILNNKKYMVIILPLLVSKFLAKMSSCNVKRKVKAIKEMSQKIV